MEKKENGYFKAVSILSLVCAIITFVALVIVIVAVAMDFEYFMTFFETLENEGISNAGEILSRTEIVAMFVMLCVYLASYVVVCIIAFVKLRKYTYLTNEEAKTYNGKIIAWVVVMFLFGGTILGIIMLMGYLNVTKVQIEQLSNDQEVGNSQNTGETQMSEALGSQDLDAMMERLEKLNKPKEMGGLSDEEYENLRKRIVNNK